MAAHLFRLLGTEDVRIQSFVQRLESASGNQGIDVRLSAEVVGKAHMTMKSLGLDPHDSDGREVYAALMDMVERHDSFLLKHIGLDQTAHNDEVVTALHALIRKLHIPRRVWVIKHARLKKILTEKPPRRAMKALGYRSVASMLKREPAPHVLAVAMHVESDAWKKRYYKQYQSVTHLDFELRDIQFCMPTTRHWNELGARISSELQNNIITIREVGAIVLLPLPNEHIRGVCIALLTLLLLQAEELRVYSSYLKLHQMKPDFGDILSNIAFSTDEAHVKVLGEKMHWRVLHTHLGSGDASIPDFFEPHVSIEDLSWRKVEDVFCAIEPALNFWRGNEYVGGVYGATPVSHNLLDAIVNYSNKIPYEHRVVSHMRSALWDEMLTRYIGSNHVRSLALGHLREGFFDESEVIQDINTATYS